MLSILLLNILGSGLAFAQQGDGQGGNQQNGSQQATAGPYDVRAFSLTPGDGDLLDPLANWRPEAHVPGSFGFQAIAEYAKVPVVSDQLQGDGASAQPLIDDLFGVNLGVALSPARRLQLQASMPVWALVEDDLGNVQQALGDLRISAPVTLIAPPKPEPGEQGYVGPEVTGPEGGGGEGVTLAVIPFVDVPTGDDEMYLGSGQFTGGGVAALGVGGEAWQIFATGGAEVTPEVDFQELNEGLFVKAGLGAGLRIVRGFAVRAEANMNHALEEDAVPLTESPAEAIVSLRGRGQVTSWTLGGATAITPGDGAARYRAFAGFGLTFGKQEQEVRPVPTALSIFVRDEKGNPVEDAEVSFGDESVTTDAAGLARFEELTPSAISDLRVEADTYKPEQVTQFTLSEGENQRVVVLQGLDATLKIVALSDTGQPADADVRFLEGPAPRAMVRLGADGEETVDLAPGDWKILVAIDQSAPQERDLTLDPGEFETVVVRFTVEQPRQVSGQAQQVCDQPVLLSNVHFDFNDSKPRPEAYPVLRNIATQLKDCPEVVIEVGGHTDWIGSDGYNLELSQARMDAVRNILAGYGVPADRLIAVGYGEARPVAPNTTDLGRALNRRVEFKPLQGQALVVATPEPPPATRVPGRGPNYVPPGETTTAEAPEDEDQ